MQSRLLLDDCRSEAKRWGGPGPDLLQLAAVVARSNRELFKERHGEDAPERVLDLVRRGVRVGDESEVIALLVAAPRNDPLPYVIDALVGKLDSPVQAPAPTTVGVGSDPAPASASASATATVSSAAVEENEPRGWSVPGRSTPFVDVVAPDAEGVLGMDDAIEDVLALIGRRSPVTPLLSAPPGRGRTSFIAALAARLNDASYKGPLAGMPIVRIKPEAIVAAERARTLRKVLEDVDGAVVVVDDLEVLLAMSEGFVDIDTMGVVRSAMESDRFRTMFTLDASFRSSLEAVSRELSSEVVTVTLPAMPLDQVMTVATRTAEALAKHYGVAVPENVVTAAAGPATRRDVLVHPGLVVSRIDGACARAAARGSAEVTEADLGLVADAAVAPLNGPPLAERLRLRVLGQDHAVTRIANRLALTRARLDLRPERPDGAFLFVGPTGVGKTEMARTICAELYGDEDRLIRLDMSEYAQSWALSRLVGPMPGYVGSTEPESWLTTRVKAQPETVVLLDEIEKAHPTVWNAFLQVLDVGQLTDSRGAVAEFSRAVVIMTSNLGAEVFGSTPIGFGRADRVGQDEDRVKDVIEDVMLPELINRLDDIVVFRPLDPAAIQAIAAKEVAACVDRLRDRGYVLTIGPEVVSLLAKTGYDPAYGARHLQRNIERLLLQPLAGQEANELSAIVVDGAIEWRRAEP